MPKHLSTLPIASTAFSREAFLTEDQGKVAIIFMFNKNDKICRGGYRFSKVGSFRHIAERYCSVEVVEAAYDQLVEFENSDWISSLRDLCGPQWRDSFKLRHFMIYLDSVGLFEVAAEDFEYFEDSAHGRQECVS